MDLLEQQDIRPSVPCVQEEEGRLTAAAVGEGALQARHNGHMHGSVCQVLPRSLLGSLLHSTLPAYLCVH